MEDWIEDKMAIMSEEHFPICPKCGKFQCVCEKEVSIEEEFK